MYIDSVPIYLKGSPCFDFHAVQGTNRMSYVFEGDQSSGEHSETYDVSLYPHWYDSTDSVDLHVKKGSMTGTLSVGQISKYP